MWKNVSFIVKFFAQMLKQCVVCIDFLWECIVLLVGMLRICAYCFVGCFV
jgi:hypothetical protein